MGSLKYRAAVGSRISVAASCMYSMTLVFRPSELNRSPLSTSLFRA